MVVSGCDRRWNTFFLVAMMSATYLALPPDACAVEVGCFCTFIFVSLMFVIGIGFTLIGKYQLARKLWKLSLKRTIVITALEVILLVAVLFVLQTKYYLRVLAYLPLGFTLNYLLTTSSVQHDSGSETPRKRIAMAALSSAILPLAVQFMAWVSIVLSEMITFKEVRV